jgi:serine O-acetyltransferase
MEHSAENGFRDGDEELAPLLGRVLESYEQSGAINHINGTNLPSKVAIAGICELLLQILFPGFHDAEPLHSEHLAAITSRRLNRLYRQLHLEVCKSLGGKCRSTDLVEQHGPANKVVMPLLETIPEIRGILRTDVEAAYEGDPAARSFEEIILSYPSMEAVAIQRFAHRLYQMEVPHVPRMMTEWAHSRTGIDIHPGARIGTHFFIDHGTGVVIGETCVIGSHVKLYHGVTLGAKSFQRDDAGNIVKGGKRHPNVEDHVTIYPNSTILGGETVIGHHSTIGGNVFLLQTVPAYSLVYYEERQLRILPKRNSPDAPKPAPVEQPPIQSTDIAFDMPDWENWTPTIVATLCFMLREGEDGRREVLLIRKKRGLGHGKINGPGGKLEPGETLEESAARETQEEVGLLPENLREAAELKFQFVDGMAIHCHVYLTEQFSGELVETPEALPFWRAVDAVPYEEMWQDDKFWLPQVLSGEHVEGRFVFDGERMLWHEVAVLQGV